MANSNQIQPKVVHNLDGLCASILPLVAATTSSTRAIVAIAGPPGSGKSTLLSKLVLKLQEQIEDSKVASIPMDGFHLDNELLDGDGTRAVKGAPHTFDVGGLQSMIQRIHAGESPVYGPEFDRAMDMSRNCAIRIEQRHRLVLIEGNYLLLSQPGWMDLAEYFALTISIDVPSDVLRERLISRWLQLGLSEKEALDKALGNDIPNAKTVVEKSIAADLIYQPENY